VRRDQRFNFVTQLFVRTALAVMNDYPLGVVNFQYSVINLADFLVAFGRHTKVMSDE
jgi:hypothetical protein